MSVDMKKLAIFLVLLCICIPVCMASPLPADGVVLQRVSTEYYGTAYYIDKQPIPAGTEIIAKNQMNDTMGRFTLKLDGTFGCEQSYCKNFDVFYYVNASDKNSIGAQMYVSFFVGAYRARPIVTFKENDLAKIDLIFPMTSPTPIVTQTPIIVATTVPTPIITSQQNKITSTPTEMVPVPPNQLPPLVLYGLIGVGVAIAGMIITALLYRYLYNRSDRDVTIKPD
jgi:hypothetical protein